MEVYPKKHQAIVENNLKRTGLPTPVCVVLFNTEKVEDISQNKMHGTISKAESFNYALSAEEVHEKFITVGA